MRAASKVMQTFGELPFAHDFLLTARAFRRCGKILCGSEPIEKLNSQANRRGAAHWKILSVSWQAADWSVLLALTTAGTKQRNDHRARRKSKWHRRPKSPS